MMLGLEGSLPFEELLVLIPLQDCHPIAFWAEDKAMGVDGAPPCFMPNCNKFKFLIFSEIPFCFLSTTYTCGNSVASSFLLMRFSLRRGFFHRMLLSLDGGCIPWNVTPETFLLESARQPPVLQCVLCRGWIRERRHGDLTGQGARDRLDHGCTGKHCSECRAEVPRGPFSLCELCVGVGIGPARFTPSDLPIINAMQLQQHVCLHVNPSQNDIFLLLFQLIRPEEIKAAANFFSQFFLQGSWIADLAPDEVIENFRAGQMDQLWHSFYRHHVVNAFCPRVLAACYGMQCALDTGPVLARFGSKLAANSRELYFAGMLTLPRNDKGMRQCVRDRVILATEFEQGLFEKKALVRMALRVLKLFAVDKFCHNFQCSCSIVTQANIDAGDIVACQGPILTLAEDKGQRHIWPSYSTTMPKSTHRNLARLRQFQRSLSAELAVYPFSYDCNRHYAYPNC